MGVMDERSSRVFVGVCLLVLLWIGTYWIYDPAPSSKSPSISFDVGPAPADAEPAVPEERPEPPTPVAFEPPPDPPVTDPALRVVAPGFREHTVRAGETFETIARDQLGSARLGSAIARANPLKDPRRLRAGEVIRVPLDPGNIQGVVVRADGTPGAAPEPETPPEVEYRVKAGDSLSRIAQSYYGSVRHADFIFNANRDTLPSPDRLRVGQTLRLPPLPPGD